MRETLTLYGRVDSISFHRALSTANDLRERFPEAVDVVSHIFDAVEWRISLRSLAQKFECSFDADAVEHVVLLSSEPGEVFTFERILEYGMDSFGYENTRSDADYELIVRDAIVELMRARKNPFVTISFASDDNESFGDVTFELFEKYCPKACSRFEEMCQQGAYIDSAIDRIVPGGWFQVAEGEKRPDVLEDECFELLHDRPGVLGLLNCGPHTNTPQFYCTFRAASWMDKRYEAIGRMFQGLKVLHRMESIPTRNGRPVNGLRIKSVTVKRV